jgi:hypothetical protein
MTNLLKTPTRDYRRDGNEHKMVRRFSARLYIPCEVQYPVDKNHSDIMKLAQGDCTYHAVVRQTKETLDSIRFPGESRAAVCDELQYADNNRYDREVQAPRFGISK